MDGQIAGAPARPIQLAPSATGERSIAFFPS